MCLGLAAVVAGMGGRGPADEPRGRQPERHEFTRLLMGVDVRITVWSADSDAARGAAAAAFARIAAIEDVASDWRPSSEVMRLCEGPAGRDVQVSEDLFALLEWAERISMASGGAFDATIGAVTHLRRAGGTPTNEAMRRATALVGYRSVVLDRRARTARLARSGIMIDLGGIAQGYAAREALGVMEAAGFGACAVDVSGDLALGDAPPGEGGWRVAIPTADGWQTRMLARCGVSTSGDSEQFIVVDGRRESHILGPRSGRGVVGMRSVTVVAQDPVLCDGMATAVSVLGVERGLALADRMEGVEMLVVTEEANGALTIVRSRRWPSGPVR